MNDIDRQNKEKFSQIKKLNLPLGQYAITGSGALGIRNLREIGDIDIIVTTELWNILAVKYGVIKENDVEKVNFPCTCIDAFHKGSFFTKKRDEDAPTFADRIASSEMIDELPFESLQNVLYYKRKMGREKDLRDILLIETLIKEKDFKL